MSTTPSTSRSGAKVPLTRRKWLESSIPGLIFGGGEEEEGSDRDRKENAFSSDNHEGQSSVRSQPAVPSSRCKLSPYKIDVYYCLEIFSNNMIASVYT